MGKYEDTHWPNVCNANAGDNVGVDCRVCHHIGFVHKRGGGCHLCEAIEQLRDEVMRDHSE